MTIKYKNVYINETATIAGPFEKKGPLKKYYDFTYDDFYMGAKTFEQAESKLIEESVSILLKKINYTKNKIDLFISGDLLNQTVASNYAASNLNIPFLGIYNACATSVEGIIIGANMLENKMIKNCICCASSHNLSAEKQFRYPVEYGAPKPNRSTFTTTGAASCFMTNDKKNIKVESSTIGRVVDLGMKDVFNMGAVMAPSAADTINRHLHDTKRDITYYDLIVTGDLGIIGSKILKDYMLIDYNIKLKKHIDTACCIFDLKKQNVYAGGSGPACAPLVTYSYLFSLMKKGKYKKILLVATGALMNSTMVNQKLTIPAISHAVSLEVV